MPATDFQTLELATDGGVATLRLNRPKALNALDAATLAELGAALDQLAGEPSVRALVVTGAGERAFCAGADIAAMSAMTGEEGHAYGRLGHAVLGRLDDLGIPVVAAVNGVALGGGCELALACDLIVAGERARLGLPEITLGLIPGFGGTQRLVERIGLARARELIYLGGMIPAEEALRVGLVNRVVPDDRLADEAQGLARELASRAPVAMRQAKRATRAAAEALLAPGLRYEVEAFGVTFSSADRVEGLRAFLEKRKPEWTGR
jgi:enoyl-CoA hydratase